MTVALSRSTGGCRAPTRRRRRRLFSSSTACLVCPRGRSLQVRCFRDGGCAVAAELSTLTGCADDAGGSQEGYVKWLCRAAHRSGARAVVLNYRGCGGLALLTPRCYNAVFTADIHETVHYLRLCAPRHPLCRASMAAAG